MTRPPETPIFFDVIDSAFQQQKLAMDATETIWHRSMQLATGQMSLVEGTAMWWEKPTAIAAGFEKAAVAAMAGHSAPKIMQAALEPMTKKASKNAKRLR